MGGKLRIWDTVNKTHLLKYEYQPLAGAIKDIAWTEDSKRLAVCGEGRERYRNITYGFPCLLFVLFVPNMQIPAQSYK